MLFPERLKYFRLEKGLSEEQLGEVLDVSSSAIHLYECGKMQVSMELLENMARFFDVSPALLLGTQYPDLPIEEAVASYRIIQELLTNRQGDSAASGNSIGATAQPKQKKRIGTTEPSSSSAGIKTIPVYGRINAEQLFNDRNIEFNWPISDSITRQHGNDLRSYFYLRVQGDRMEPTLGDEDIVLVKKQVRVENNELAVVISGKEDAGISRFKYMPGKILMNYDNERYGAESYNAYEDKILGKVIWKTRAPKKV